MANRQNRDGVERASARWTESAVKAALIAGDLGLQDCDGAVS